MTAIITRQKPSKEPLKKPTRRFPSTPISRVSDTREIGVHPNYLVIYRIATDHITIVNVLHTRQKYP
ncbi:type II toxin-antitoxin system RelE/ParE family toxin [Halomonas hibernica]|uniref:type II toxin-antitoxin system RelE/ParE family toxin n=1 Tax=Halomonas hibernica TaxID=2591147 RepID=UPI0029E82533|nr:type II toxin-antitoxin system RelE/ParE family toxin [Halomonas hibernica]